jgi:hypothetical protein
MLAEIKVAPQDAHDARLLLADLKAGPDGGW